VLRGWGRGGLHRRWVQPFEGAGEGGLAMNANHAASTANLAQQALLEAS
jgi:hypothetical protein